MRNQVEVTEQESEVGVVHELVTVVEVAPIGSAGVGLPVGGTAGQVLIKLNNTDYATGWLTFTKSNVGLNNVDNTADVDKPISTLVQQALDNKANTVHTHTISQVTGLEDVLDSFATQQYVDDTFAPLVHTHVIADVTGLQSALDGKAALVHGHVISDVSGLQAELDGKADTVHQHVAADVTDFSSAADDRIALQKAQANGLATLGGDGKIPTSQLNALAITSTFVVASQAAQLALTAQEGDVAVRTDLNKTYIHNAGAAGTMADWTELLTPTDSVLSVNGQTGAVVLTTSNIAEGTNLYYTDSRADARAAAAVTADTIHVLKTGDTMTGNLTFTNSGVIAGTSTNVFGAALTVMRNGTIRGTIDNTANGLRVIALTNALYVQGRNSTGLMIDGAAVAWDSGITSVSYPTGLTEYFYNTADQTTNYDRVQLGYASNVFNIVSGSNGTGTVRTLQIGTTNRLMQFVETATSAGFFRLIAGTSGGGVAGTVISGIWNASTGQQTVFAVTPTINQTGNASATDLLVNRTQTAVGSGTQNLLDLQVAGSSFFSVNNTGMVNSGPGSVTGSNAGFNISTNGGASGSPYGMRNRYFPGNSGVIGGIALTGEAWSGNSAYTGSLMGAAMSVNVNGTGTITAAYGLRTQISVVGANTGGIITGNALRILSADKGSSTGFITNNYGLYIEDQTAGATLNYSIYTNAGRVRLGGTLEVPYVSVSADTTLDTTHYTVAVNATGASRTIPLPAASTCAGRIYIIKKTDVTANTVTVDPSGAETVDGAATYVLSAQWKYVVVQSTGTAWLIVGNN